MKFKRYYINRNNFSSQPFVNQKIWSKHFHDTLTKLIRAKQNSARLNWVRLQFSFFSSFQRMSNKRRDERKIRGHIKSFYLRFRYQVVQFGASICKSILRNTSLWKEMKRQWPGKVQSNSTSCPRLQTGKEYKQLRRHKVKTTQAEKQQEAALSQQMATGLS